MKSSNQQFAFRETSLFDWDSEPCEERPSGFAAPTLSAFAPLPARRRKRPASWLSVTSVAAFGALGFGVALLLVLMHLLHA